MAVDPLRIAIVGCGAIASAYILALRGVLNLRLVAVADTHPGTAARTSRNTGLPCHASVTDLLERERLDAALVLTPPHTHESIACELLESRLHVLCEKPVAMSTQAAQNMFATADRFDRQLMVGAKFRYVDDLNEARRLLDSGLIGEPLLLENVFCSHVDMVGRWNSVRALSGGGVLIDNGCHSVDIARFLLGPITRVQARFGAPVQELEVEDTAQLIFEVESGALGCADLSWSLHKEVDAYVRVHGSLGTLEVGWKSSRYKLKGHPGWTAFGTGYDKVRALASQLRNFAGSILGSEQPMISDEDALSSVAVIDAAYRSALDLQWNTV